MTWLVALAVAASPAAKAPVFFDVDAVVVDAAGAPLQDVELGTNDDRATTGADGRFHLRLRRDHDCTLRASKLGFRPVIVDDPRGLTKLVLAGKRTLITVKVIDPKTKEPVRHANVAIWRGNEKVSSCSAAGECTLDAEPGELELQVYDSRRPIKVGDTALSVTVEEPEQQLNLDSRYFRARGKR
ncbi:MAG: hypothetical protein QM723_25305 [Myxococcaceae bacterium]